MKSADHRTGSAVHDRGNARFVPPPHTELAEVLSSLERWFHAEDDLPTLVRAGLAHVQFETIHPFLDGNGRIGQIAYRVVTGALAAT